MKSRTGFLISRIKQVQDRVFQRLLQNFGVEEFNGPQGRILYVLWQKDEVPIVELSSKTGLAKNTLTAMLARMEVCGLLQRKASDTDKRQSIIVLTAKARELKDKYDEVSEQMNTLFFTGFSQEEVTLLDSRLDRILQNLEQAEHEYKKQGQE
ncbi:MAG: MarR family transcriptional regulator [Treponemataceae bacterium]|nr:MarR family transcriptional regulator [Treponemataceae bacterium]